MFYIFAGFPIPWLYRATVMRIIRFMRYKRKISI